MPACSPTKRRSLPGQRVTSRGFLNFRLGKARTTLKGRGGSGEPTTREVVHGVRAGLVAAVEASHATAMAPNARTETTITERRRAGKRTGMRPTTPLVRWLCTL